MTAIARTDQGTDGVDLRFASRRAPHVIEAKAATTNDASAAVPRSLSRCWARPFMRDASNSPARYSESHHDLIRPRPVHASVTKPSEATLPRGAASQQTIESADEGAVDHRRGSW